MATRRHHMYNSKYEFRNQYGTYEKNSINAWLNDKARWEGATQKNVDFLREMKGIDKEFQRINCIAYFMVARLEMTGLRQIMISGKRQRGFVKVTIQDLKKYKVTKEYVAAFEKDIRKLHDRCDHIFMVIMENLRLTEYYPYFYNAGAERLIDFSIEYPAGDDECADRLFAEIEAYKSEHPEIIAAHMAATEEERRNLAEHRARNIQRAKEEKAARRAAKKEENDEIKEMKANAKKHRMEEKKIERSFGYLYK